MNKSMNRRERILATLTRELAPSHIELHDESAKHAGHSGARPGGETHYRLTISSPLFMGKSKVAQHQMIYALLADELANGLHALAIEVRG